MKSKVSIFGSAAVLGAMLTAAGCGSDKAAPVATSSTQVATSQATLNNDGTLTTSTAITAQTAGSTTAITIPAATTITAKDAAGNPVSFASLPVIYVSTPTSGVSGMPQPSTTGFTIDSTAGAVDVYFGGYASATFSQPVTITIPVDPAKVSSGIVLMNKKDGNGYVNIGTATITGNVATITTTSLCWFSVDDDFRSSTGTTGGTGGSGNGEGF